MTDGIRIGTAVVLGGGSDIAAAVLAAAVPRGLHHAVLAARRPDDATARVQQVAPDLRTTAVHWDALDVDGHDALFDRVARELGSIDLVLCAAGMLGHHAGRSMGPADVDLMVRTNFAGPAAALAVAAERLADQGRGTIMVLSSVAGLRARRSNYVYGSSKSGLDAFAQGLGDALAGTGVRCIVVRPGFVRSAMTVGLDPAPFSTDPTTVARHALSALDHPHRDTVYVPPLLGPMFAGLRAAPRPLWRRISGNR
jgi:decaprenylphospho-beta-D-erythro-pentofuranosid-2-ulose 2-reductase